MSVFLLSVSLNQLTSIFFLLEKSKKERKKKENVEREKKKKKKKKKKKNEEKKKKEKRIKSTPSVKVFWIWSDDSLRARHHRLTARLCLAWNRIRSWCRRHLVIPQGPWWCM